jgi:hypothetical protein
MKREKLFVSGILVGVGLTLGVMHFRCIKYPEQAAVTPHKQETLPLRSDSKAQANASAANALTAKIERLRRWSQDKEPSLEREEVLKMLEEWSEADAQTALAFVTNVPRFPGRNEAYAIPLAALCCRELKTALSWIYGNVAGKSERAQIADMIVRRIQDKAPAAGLEFAEAPNIPVDTESFGHMIGVLVRTQPQLALQHFERLSPSGKEIAIEPMLSLWAQTNPESAISWFKGQEGKSTEALVSLIESCVKNGPYRLGNLVQRLGLSGAEADVVLVRLSHKNVYDDVNEFDVFSAKAKQEAAESLAARGLETDPNQILRFVKTSVPPENQSEVIFNGWINWFDSDSKAALDWLRQQPDLQLANELTRRLTQRELARDPLKALAALPTVADPEQRKRNATDALGRLANGKPEAAVAWLSQNQTTPVGVEVYGELASNFLRRDEAAAMNWIAKLDNGEAKDSALRAAAYYWSEKEVEFATTSMATIEDSEKRQACMFDLYRQLSRKDSTTAEQWLEKQGLSAEVRESWKALANR